MNPFVALGMLLLAIWAALWLGVHVVPGLIHLLLVVAPIMIVRGMVKRGAATVSRNHQCSALPSWRRNSVAESTW